MTIPIVLQAGATMPVFKTDGAACADLCALVLDASNVTIEPGEVACINTGVSMELPTGYVAQLHVRSSIGVKKQLMLVNSTGIIDSDYRGEWIVFLLNNGKETQVINHGDAIVQVLILKHERPSFKLVEVLNETTRGTGGFGSTGI